MDNKNPTIQQIALAAGISPSTVSRVINNYAGVTEKTRRKVQSFIDFYNYQPNVAAQSLNNKSTKTLSVFFPYEFLQIDDIFSTDNVICHKQVKAISTAATERGYRLLASIISEPSNPEQQDMIRRTFRSGMVDGGIFVDFDEPSLIVEEMAKDGYIVGVLNHEPEKNFGNGHIVFCITDREIGMYAVSYLYGLGHRKIAVIGGPERKYSSKQRCYGILQAMKDFNIESVWFERVELSARATYDCLLNKLQRTQEDNFPTAIICGSDTIAFGAIEALKKANLIVPEDVSVIGMDNHILCTMIKPALTTFDVDTSLILLDLTTAVIDCIENNFDSPVRKQYRFSFIERDSCCPPKKTGRVQNA